MDLAELKKRFDKSREVTEEIGSRSFTLRLPTRAVALLVVESDASSGRAVYQLLIDAVVGWKGVTVGDIAPDDPEAHEPLPCTAESIPLFLDSQIEVLGALSARFLDALRRRNEIFEAARKNSPSASSGSSAAPRRSGSKGSD